MKETDYINAYEKGLDDYNGFTGFYNFGKDDDS